MASIRKRKNTYQVTVSNGRRKDGSQIIETATFVPDPEKTERQNKKALELFALKFEEQVKAGKYLDGEKITFRDFSERYMEEYARHHLDQNTYRTYDTLLRIHIIPAIGDLKLSKIQPRSLNNLYNQMLEQRRDGKPGGYSIKTIRHVHTVISAVYTTAVTWNVTTDNPCERVSPPSGARKKSVKYFTLEQTEAFLTAIDNGVFQVPIRAHDRIDDTGKPYHVRDYTEKKTLPTQFRVLFYIAIYSGMRRGEIVALEWSDFDFKRNLLSISKNSVQVNGKVVRKEPKTEGSVRVISVPATVMNLVKAWRKEYLQYQLSLGDAWEGDNSVFIQWNGKQMYPSTPYNMFKKVIRWYNASVQDPDDMLPDIPFHGLRHTSATLLITSNVDVRTVAGRLGHSQASTTMNIYSHFLKRADEAAADTLESLLAPEDKKEKTLVKC